MTEYSSQGFWFSIILTILIEFNKTQTKQIKSHVSLLVSTYQFGKTSLWPTRERKESQWYILWSYYIPVLWIAFINKRLEHRMYSVVGMIKSIHHSWTIFYWNFGQQICGFEEKSKFCQKQRISCEFVNTLKHTIILNLNVFN